MQCLVATNCKLFFHSSGNGTETALTLLIVTELTIGAPPSAGLLQGLFDLTPAEARVARAIAAGRAASEIAREHGVSGETIRSQLRAIFAKTGVSRQVELVRLLSGATLP